MNEFPDEYQECKKTGRYKDVRLIDNPEEYFLWLMRKGLPEGNRGRMMSAVYEIKVNAPEHLFGRFR